MEHVFKRNSSRSEGYAFDPGNEVYDKFPAPIVIYRNWRILHVNCAACRLFKSTQKQLIGLPVFKLVKKGQHRVLKRILEQLRPGNPFTMFIELQDTEGNDIQAELTSTLVDRSSNSYVLSTIREHKIEKSYHDLSMLVMDLLPLSGNTLYRKLVRSLSIHLNLNMVLLARYEPSKSVDRYQGLAMELDSELHERFSIDVFEEFARSIVKDQSLALFDLKNKSSLYNVEFNNISMVLGIPLHNELNQVVGVLICGSNETIENEEYVYSALNLIGVKAAIEIQRQIDKTAIEASERKYRLLMQQAADAIILTGKDDQIEHVNTSASEMLGYSMSELLRMKVKDIFAVENDQLPGAKTLEVRQLKRKDSSFFFAEISTAVQDNSSRQYIIRDITERLRAEAERKSHLDTLSLLEELVIEMDDGLRILQVNDAWPKLFPGVDPTENPHFPTLIHRDYQQLIEQTLQSMFANPRKIQLRFPVFDPDDNDVRWYEARFVTLEKQVGTGIRGLIRDMTVDYLSEKKRHFATFHDSLTGLPNRVQMQEDLERIIGRCERHGGKVAFGLMDLDRFFEINEILGHHLGDQVIALFADKLKHLNLFQYLYRWGGDQFVFILEDLKEDELDDIIKTVLDSFMNPIQFESENIHVTASGGVSIYPDDTFVADELIGLADRAMNWAKKHGRYAIKRASDLPQKSFLGNELTMKRLLAEAIHQEEIEAYFQPIVDSKTGKITGMEALARCPDRPGYGRIGPGIFIPIVENMGLIGELGAVILKKGMSFLAKLQSQGYQLDLSVNLSRRQLYADDLVIKLLNYTREFGIDPSNIILEITESLAMLEIDHESKKLHLLKKAGFKVAIDDFGTGYSTLAQLHEMPVDELKIDMAFVRRIHSNEGYRILQAIVSLGKALQLFIVAEGVEEELAAKKLAELKIEALQGYHFSPPVTAEEFEELLKDSNSKSPSVHK